MAEHDDLAEVWARIQSLVLRNDVRTEVSETLGLSFVKTRALRRLLPGPLTMRELAEALSTDKPYVTLIVDHLEELGLVTRNISPQDRRARIVALTESGREAGERAEEIVNRPPAGLSGLPKEDLAALNRILKTLPDNRAAGRGDTEHDGNREGEGLMRTSTSTSASASTSTSQEG